MGHGEYETYNELFRLLDRQKLTTLKKVELFKIGQVLKFKKKPVQQVLTSNY